MFSSLTPSRPLLGASSSPSFQRETASFLKRLGFQLRVAAVAIRAHHLLQPETLVVKGLCLRKLLRRHRDAGGVDEAAAIL